ncbi:MAG: efflux RND transporter permease subunit, partial [Paracoccaceae bacterium]
MNAIIDWAGRHARMVMAFIALTLIAGTLSYTGLPKEGDPDIEIPGLFVSVPFPGISAQDSERLVIRPMESEMADLEGLKSLSATAAENYAGLWLEFEFGWDKSAILADVRDRMNRAEAEFPAGAESYSINEFNFSQFPIIIVQLTGDVPERTLVRAARAMQDALETLEPVLEATLTGFRDEMVEVIIDPLRLETHNLTASELISIIRANNQLIAAGEVETAQGSYALKIPGAFARPDDIHALPVKTNGDRVVTLGDLAEVRMTFADRTGTARYNGDTTVALQVVKRKGFNVIDTAALVRDAVAAEYTSWPDDMRAAISVGTSNDRSVQVTEVVSQLEGAVLTAVALVMIVILGSLGIRSALLVGFAIPTSFLLAFILLGLFGVTISNIVMFALILAVGILVDGAIVVVEYADRRLAEGAGQMQAYTDAAKRLFWPITSSTATTLCAFLPMLFWPGVAGEFMGMLPVTIITVLTASLLVTLIYVPVMGGVTGRFARVMERASALLRAHLPLPLRLGIAALAAGVLFVACLQLINPGFIFGGVSPRAGWLAHVPGGALFLVGTIATSIAMGALRPPPAPPPPEAGESRNLAGRLTHIIVRSPISALAAIGAVMATVAGIFLWYGAANNGTTFMEPTEPDQAIIYISARGNLSLAEKDALVNQAETLVR